MLMLSYLGWLNLLDRSTFMVEVVLKNVLGIKVWSEQQQYFLLQTERRWENIVDHSSTSQSDE